MINLRCKKQFRYFSNVFAQKWRLIVILLILHGTWVHNVFLVQVWTSLNAKTSLQNAEYRGPPSSLDALVLNNYTLSTTAEIYLSSVALPLPTLFRQYSFTRWTIPPISFRKTFEKQCAKPCYVSGMRFHLSFITQLRFSANGANLYWRVLSHTEQQGLCVAEWLSTLRLIS